MQKINFAISNVCSAFETAGVGTKVLKPGSLLGALTAAVEAHDQASDRVPGQHFINLPAVTFGFVSAGVGRRSEDPEDYVLRAHRGVVEAFLRREKAAAVEGLACVVYTRAAYNADPDVVSAGRQVDENTTHVVVAVLAFAGPKAPLGAERFVHNLAGGNNEALQWSGDEIREKAAEVATYWKSWSTVAD